MLQSCSPRPGAGRQAASGQPAQRGGWLRAPASRGAKPRAAGGGSLARQGDAAPKRRSLACGALCKQGLLERLHLEKSATFFAKNVFDDVIENKENVRPDQMN